MGTGNDPDLTAVMAAVSRMIADPAQISGRTCTIAGCGRKHYGQGLCRAHHARWRRAGDPGGAAIAGHVRHGRVCSVEDCAGTHQARGLCQSHYSRWRRTGDVEPAKPRRRHTCGRPHCGQRHYRQGMCQNHYQQWVKSGATRAPLDGTACAQAYRDGASAASLAKRFGYTPRAVRDTLRAAGVQIRPPGTRRRRHIR